MVSMAESYLQFLEKRVINEALHQQPPVNPITYRRYVDDSNNRFLILAAASKCLGTVNKQDRRIQWTMEVENKDKILDYLDNKSKNGGQGTYEF